MTGEENVFRKIFPLLPPAIIILSVSGVLLSLLVSRAPAADIPIARGGIFDARGRDFRFGGGIPLRGEWKFLPGIFTGALGGPAEAEGAEVLTVPGAWNGRKGAGLSGPYGIGTYELTLLTDPGGTDLGLLIPDQGIAYRCYVNGELGGENGVPGETYEGTRVVRETVLVPLDRDRDTHHVVFHAANFHYNVGGLINPVVLGPSRTLALWKEMKNVFSGFLLGAVLIIALYHVLLYYHHREDRTALYFSLFCFFVFLRVLTVEHFPERFFPGPSAFAVSSRIEFLSYYLGLPVYLFFIGNLYPLRYGPYILKAAAFIAGAFSLAVIILPVPLFMAHTLTSYHVLTLAAGVYVLINLAEAAARKREGALTLLFGFALFFLFIINDILHADMIIRTAHLTPLGLLFFVLTHFTIIAARYAGIGKRAERLARELLAEKGLLDKRVAERTADLEKANRKLKEMDRAKLDFFASISHEFRTPLTLILSPVEQVLKKKYGEAVPSDSEFFRRLRRNAYRLETLIDGLMAFSRLELGVFRPKKRLFDLAGILRFFVSELGPLAENKGLTLTFENALASPLDLYADPGMFETAFFNILSNAVKFTPPGGSVTVLLAGPDARGRAVVKVIDTGIGIEKTHLPHIFKKFYQGRSSRTGLQDGSGIGLALTKEIVELHGGSIGAESLPGEGSAFTLLFPALPHTAGSGIPEDSGRRVRGILIDAETPHHTTEAPAAAEGKGGKNRSVLVVEDNEELLSLLRNELEVRYKVYTARNGGEALVLLNHVSKPDIIVSDIMMPGMDGTILFRTLKKRHDFADVPFLFLTARAEKEEKLALLSAGAVDYIHKPFDMEELGLKIEGLLSLRDSIRRAAIVLAEAPGTLPDNLTGPTLTKREQDISRLLQVGFSDKEIAAALGISARTVSNILGKLYRRTGVSGRLELVRFLRPS